MQQCCLMAECYHAKVASSVSCILLMLGVLQHPVLHVALGECRTCTCDGLSNMDRDHWLQKVSLQSPFAFHEVKLVVANC